MDAKIVIPLFAIFLLIGAVGGYVANDGETVVQERIVEVDKIVEVEVPGENVTVEVASAQAYLDTAVNDFLVEIEDEDELTECGEYDYDFDEISVSRVYDEWTLSTDGDDYTVDFEVRLKYDEDDERSCKDTYEVSIFYEEDEDLEFDY